MLDLHSKFATPASINSLVMAIKGKTNIDIVVATLSFYTLQTRKFSYHTKFNDAALSGVSFAPISKVCTAAMPVLPWQQIKNYVQS
jgi:hypothetical protein